jgi:hypothetical protein
VASVSRVERAWWVTAQWTYGGSGKVSITPPDVMAAGLGALVDRVATRFDGEGVVIVDRSAADLLTIPPADELTGQSGVRDYPALDRARDLGWTVHGLGRWATFYGKGRPSVYLGVADAIDPAWSALWAPWPPDTIHALRVWHELTGSAYHHSPGAAGVAVLMAAGARGHRVAWKAEAGPDRDGAAELRWEPTQWSAPPPPGTSLYGYDKTAAGLAAITTTLVARRPLEHHPRLIHFDRKLAGWWRIEIPAWNLGHQMPHPAGYYVRGQVPGRDELVRWVTSPTLDLLWGLADQGLCDRPRIIDAWTAPATDLMRDWGRVLSRTRRHARLLASAGDMDAAAVAEGIGEAASQATGMIGSPTSARVYRRDWHHALGAMQRCNVWRAGWAVGCATGSWPVRVDGDKLVLPLADPPAGLRYDQSGSTVGAWRLEHTEKGD